MSCPTLDGSGSEGIAAALRVVDCMSAEATASAFGRLFGPSGALGTALTILLTLYVALLAVNLLTGRSKLGLNAFTPRMLGLGLVLTFATSWIAYQSVVWTLLANAPDQIAAVVTGQSGSATATFAKRLDAVFAAVAQAADLASQAAPATETGITPAPPQAAGWTAADVLWMAAMLLLLGTVGVLLVARIALAALLALGPVFIVLALFRGTHGLFVGWLKGAVMMALVPLFTVLLGGAALALLAPVVTTIMMKPVTMQAAVTMFLGASVYVALMVMVLKVSGTMVSGWRIGSREPGGNGERGAAAQPAPALAAPAEAGSTPVITLVPEPRASSDRVRAIVAGVHGPARESVDAPGQDRRVHMLAAPERTPGMDGPIFAPASGDRRIQGVGTRFREPPARLLGKMNA